MKITTHVLWAMLHPYMSTHSVQGDPRKGLSNLVHARSLIMFLNNENSEQSISIKKLASAHYMYVGRHMPQGDELISTKVVRILARSSLDMGEGRAPYHTYLNFFNSFSQSMENRTPNGHMWPEIKHYLASPFYGQCLINLWDNCMARDYNRDCLTERLYERYTSAFKLVESLRPMTVKIEIQAIVDNIDRFLRQPE